MQQINSGDVYIVYVVHGYKVCGSFKRYHSDGYIAQWLERLTADQQVPGSNPGVSSGQAAAGWLCPGDASQALGICRWIARI